MTDGEVRMLDTGAEMTGLKVFCWEDIDEIHRVVTPKSTSHP